MNSQVATEYWLSSGLNVEQLESWTLQISLKDEACLHRQWHCMKKNSLIQQCGGAYKDGIQGNKKKSSPRLDFIHDATQRHPTWPCSVLLCNTTAVCCVTTCDGSVLVSGRPWNWWIYNSNQPLLTIISLLKDPTPRPHQPAPCVFFFLSQFF